MDGYIDGYTDKKMDTVRTVHPIQTMVGLVKIAPFSWLDV